MLSTTLSTLLPDVPLLTLTGQPCHLHDFAGQVLLVVNVASRCGFTPQYRGLEALHRSQIGPVELPDDLKPGEWRWLTKQQVAALVTKA